MPAALAAAVFSRNLFLIAGVFALATRSEPLKPALLSTSAKTLSSETLAFNSQHAESEHCQLHANLDHVRCDLHKQGTVAGSTIATRSTVGVRIGNTDAHWKAISLSLLPCEAFTAFQ